MPSIAAVLKEEIVRLARKKIRTQTNVLRKASTQYRRDIAAMGVASRFMLPKPSRCLSRMLPTLEAGADVRQCTVLPLHPARPAAAKLRRACAAAHSHAAADPSEIPLRPSQFRTSRDYPKRIEQPTFLWALTIVTFPVEAMRLPASRHCAPLTSYGDFKPAFSAPCPCFASPPLHNVS
jgi:hypothetical protein